MNINKSIFKRLSIVAVLLMILVIYVFDPFIEQVRHYPIGLSDFSENIGYYKIDPATILTSLGNDETLVFLLETVTPEKPVIESPISWHQSDHLKVASALFKFVWQEPVDDWNLYYMNFNAVCHDNPNGFGLGDFYYFKPKFTYGRLGYTTRELFITPQFGDTTWGGGANFPYPLFGWKSINLDKIKITAEDALKIAEKNGSKEARLSVQNSCTIRVRLAGYDDAWKIRISENDTGLEIFKMNIDPYTGEIK